MQEAAPRFQKCLRASLHENTQRQKPQTNPDFMSHPSPVVSLRGYHGPLRGQKFRDLFGSIPASSIESRAQPTPIATAWVEGIENMKRSSFDVFGSERPQMTAI